MVGIENRKCNRYYIINDIYVIIDKKDDNLAKVKNLSLGGLALQHLSDHKIAKQDITLDIFDIETESTIENIPGQIVYEKESDKFNTKDRCYNRCGVKFDALMDMQKQQIESLIKVHGQIDDA